MIVRSVLKCDRSLHTRITAFNNNTLTKRSEFKIKLQNTHSELKNSAKSKLASLPATFNNLTGYTVVQECKERVRTSDVNLKLAKLESESVKSSYENVSFFTQ